jgi:hypothetical protein
VKMVPVAAAALVPDSSTSTTALCTICGGQQVLVSCWGLGESLWEMAKLLPMGRTSKHLCY